MWAERMEEMRRKSCWSISGFFLRRDGDVVRRLRGWWDISSICLLLSCCICSSECQRNPVQVSSCRGKRKAETHKRFSSNIIQLNLTAWTVLSPRLLAQHTHYWLNIKKIFFLTFLMHNYQPITSIQLRLLPLLRWKDNCFITLMSFRPLELRRQTKRRSDSWVISAAESQAVSLWFLLLRSRRVGRSYLCFWITLSHAYEKVTYCFCFCRENIRIWQIYVLSLA